MSQKWRKYSPKFRRELLEKMKTCPNISQLAREAGVPRKFLYKWKAEEARRSGKGGGGDGESISAGNVAKLRQEVQALRALTARQSLELDFFRGALQRVEERRQKRAGISRPESTSKSGN
jgi:hypothetical protein